MSRPLYAGLTIGVCFLLTVLVYRPSHKGPLDASTSVLRASLELAEREARELRNRLDISSEGTARLRRENKKLAEQLAAAASQLADVKARRQAGAVEATEPAPPKRAATPAAVPAAVVTPAVRGPSALEKRLLGGTEFTKERALLLATNKQLLVTFTNKIRLDFATTWVYHVRALKMTNWLVGATDAFSLKALQEVGTPTFSMHMDLPEGEWPWGSRSFKALGPHKIELIYKCLQWGLEMIITDIDALVLREPFAFMARWPDAGFLTTSDHLGNTTKGQGLETHGGIHTAFNIGYMFFRNSSMPLVEEWRRVIKEQPEERWDQGEFNRLARLDWKWQRPIKGGSDPNLFNSYKNVVVGGVLPLALFCGGHNYFVSQLAQRNGWAPYSIHTTYQYAAAAGKRHRLREARVWIDPPTYYDPPGGLLAFDIDQPERLVHPAGGMSVQGHIELINHQLAQVRDGLALAHALGRTLVLPAVICGYDKYWGPLWGRGDKGVIPGTHSFALPIYNCPLDHFLEVGMIDPVATVREWSFLTNPRTPDAVTRGVRREALRETTPQRLAELKRLADAKVLNVGTLQGLDVAKSGMFEREQFKQIKRKYGHVVGSWCCAPTDEQKAGAPRSYTFRLFARD